MIPLEDFFRNPDKLALRLSPSGRYVAYLEPWQRRLNVVVQDIASGDTVRVTSATERNVASYFWANDARLVYLRDIGGDENHRLYAVSRDGSNPVDLTPFEGVKCQLIDDLKDDNEEILVGMNRRNPEVFDAYRLNVYSGEMRLVGDNQGNITSWHADHEGRLRVATTTDGANTSILYREDEGADWRTVATYDFREHAYPLLFTFDNESIYVASNVDRDKLAIFEYDLDTGREGRLIFENDEVDVYNLLHSRQRKYITGVTFEVDRPGFHFFDPERERIQQLLDERLQGYVNRLTSCSKDENKYVVLSSSDRTRGSYHLLDLETEELTPLFEVAPWLDEEKMAPMTPIRLQSRDALTLNGYLTVPLGVDPKNLPLIMHPHGGPWARNIWGFNPEVQFLANRGYAVLQINFRASTGYGREFWEAGFGQWGLAMQDDVTDAVGPAYPDGLHNGLH